MGRKSKELQLLETSIVVLATKWAKAENAMENFRDTKELQAKWGELGKIKAAFLDVIRKRNEYITKEATIE